MKVLLVGPPSAIGGTEIFLSRFIPKLMNAGIAVYQKSIRSGSDIPSLIASINNYKPDILHSFLPRPYVLSSIAASFARHKPKRIHSRRCLRDTYSNHWLEQRFHHRVHAFIANSKAIVNELLDETERPIELIHNGVDIPQITTSPTTCFTITTLGNPHRYKGHQDLRDAYEMIKAKLPQPNRLEIISGNPSPIYHLRQADIFVLPSHSEGFSNALLEAMALGLPCIATCVGGNLDTIQHNISGMLVAPQHPIELAQAIHALAWDLRRRRKLAEGARERAKLFTWDKCITKHKDLYQRVANADQDRT